MANFNLNKVILGGRITQDLELKVTTSGVNWTSFSVAVNRRAKADPNAQNQQPQADFINCIAWRNTAEFLCKYFHKGSSVCITGSIQTRTWNDQQNQKHYATEVVVDEAMFVDSKQEGASAVYNAPAYSTASTEEAAPTFKEMPSDEELPF